MTNITIPDEAVEAATAEANAFYPNCYVTRAQIKAAIRAAIEAWPGVSTGPNIYGRQDAIMHLPLPPQETAHG